MPESHFPQEQKAKQFSSQLLNFSRGTENNEGGWARGQAPNEKGQFEYVDNPQPHGEEPNLNGGADHRFYTTSKKPQTTEAA